MWCHVVWYRGAVGTCRLHFLSWNLKLSYLSARLHDITSYSICLHILSNFILLILAVFVFPYVHLKTISAAFAPAVSKFQINTFFLSTAFPISKGLQLSLTQYHKNIFVWCDSNDGLCGLVVKVLGYRSGGPGSIPGTTRKKK
jgi:hypothetical protein